MGHPVYQLRAHLNIECHVGVFECHVGVFESHVGVFESHVGVFECHECSSFEMVE